MSGLEGIITSMSKTFNNDVGLRNLNKGIKMCPYLYTKAIDAKLEKESNKNKEKNSNENIDSVTLVQEIQEDMER